MCIYWMRCSLCGEYKPTKNCHLDGLPVCSDCCLLCPAREKCSKPAWFATIRPETTEQRVEDLIEELSGRQPPLLEESIGENVEEEEY